ncbi:hypothetical protein [Mycobacteroides abscessus]|uniref:hypothetical protein n=1 Tax=Mycobacteroides abscessus TaxID=36809 RepID=UPI0009A84ADE|nr:hypothetical protein [Mycobacteroides abscessus]SKK31806.1 Uncharacterised protein [Mycobacteroides abscessus subsp. abscessus]
MSPSPPPNPLAHTTAPRWPVKASLVATAYAFIPIILAVRIDHSGIQITFLAIAVLAAISAPAALLLAKKHASPTLITPTAIDAPGPAALGYLATYIPAVMAPIHLDRGYLLAYALYLSIAFLLHASTTMFQINPVMMLLGYSIVQIHTADAPARYVLTRMPIRNIIVGEPLNVVPIDSNIAMTTPGGQHD